MEAAEVVTFLELGSGDRPYEDGRGWTHLDARDLEHIEIVDDAATLIKIPPASCEEIRAAHLLEHFSHRDTVGILETWRSKLVPGGRLYIEVPDLSWQALALTNLSHRKGKTPDELTVMIFGEQDYEGNYHKTGFTCGTLVQRFDDAGYERAQCQSIGMVIIAEAYNPREE